MIPQGGGKFKLPASIGETENQKDASKATIDAVITDRQISLQVHASHGVAVKELSGLV
jgi:hypothetical protein